MKSFSLQKSEASKKKKPSKPYQNYWICIEDPFDLTHNLGRVVIKSKYAPQHISLQINKYCWQASNDQKRVFARIRNAGPRGEDRRNLSGAASVSARKPEQERCQQSRASEEESHWWTCTPKFEYASQRLFEKAAASSVPAKIIIRCTATTTKF